MTEVKLSSKNQVVIPREARDALHLQAGSRLKVVVRGDMVILLPVTGSYEAGIAGLGRGLYETNYLVAERKSWS